MHAGYPVMAFTSVADLATNLTRMKIEGLWGFFHELGHNLQVGSWTPVEQGETTNNWWSIYVNQKVIIE